MVIGIMVADFSQSDLNFHCLNIVWPKFFQIFFMKIKNFHRAILQQYFWFFGANKLCRNPTILKQYCWFFGANKLCWNPTILQQYCWFFGANKLCRNPTILQQYCWFIFLPIFADLKNMKNRRTDWLRNQ